jgi:Family of unknown function (DUF6152)
MSVRAVALSLATLLACAVGSVSAHHSYAMFDMQKEVKLEGTVKEYQWTNPHIWIQLLTMDAGGQVVEWAIECNSTKTMSNVGWTRKTLKAGDKISVVIHPLKTSADPGGALVSAVINGRTLTESVVGSRVEEPKQ